MKYLLLALLVAVVAAQDCQNPFFTGNYPVDIWLNFNYLTDPEPYTGVSQVCDGFFSVDDPQCCNDEIYRAIESAWNIVYERIELTVTLARTLRAQFERTRDNYETFKDRVRDDNNLTDEEKDRIITLFDKVVDAYDRFIDGLITLWADCASAILRYWLRIVCSGCDPNWSDYIFQNTDGYWRVRLNDEVCEDLRGGCGGYFELYITLIRDITDAFLEYAGLTPPDYPAVCGDMDCEEYICDFLVAGQQYDGTSLDGDGSAKRSVASYQALKEQLGDHGYFVEHLQALHEHVDNLAGSHKRATNSDFSQNAFTSSGGLKWDATQSSLKTDVDSANSLTSWLSFF